MRYFRVNHLTYILWGTQLLQEFVITDGISEDCILGWDAIRSHGFTIDGDNQSICLAREASGPVFSPEISIVSKQRVKVPRQSILVIETKTRGSFPYVPSTATFVFSQTNKPPKGLDIFDFVNTVSKDGIYNMLIVNN